MENAVRVGITMPRKVFEQVNKLANKRHESRSRIISYALMRLLEEQQKERMLHEAQEVYREIEKEEKETAERYLSIYQRSYRRDKDKGAG